MPTSTTTRNDTPSTNPWWFVAAPIVAVIARTLWTPFDDQDPAAYIAEVGRHPQRSGVGTLLMILSALLLIPAAFALASVLRDSKPRLARIATAMITTGAVGMAAFSMVGMFASYLAREHERTAMVAVWDRLVADPKGEILFVSILIGVIGFVALAVGLFRSGVVARGAAVLVGLGGATTLFTTGGPMRPLLVTAAAVALAGFGWVAASTRDRSPAFSRQHEAVAA